MTELLEIPDEIRSWIGTSLAEDDAGLEVERGYIATSCASVENGNPLYWDDEAATLTDGPIAPPTMLSVWMRPHHWQPGRTEQPMPLEVHFKLKKGLELPEAIVTANEISFGAPVRPGDHVRTKQVLRSLSEPKTNKLGTGRYWTIDVEYYNQKDEWVGTETYEFFGYRRD
jgi:acyl dehydratase